MIPGHGFVLQFSFLNDSPLQIFPPYLAGCKIVLDAVISPPPQLCEHSDQSLNGDHWQSDMISLTWLATWCNKSLLHYISNYLSLFWYKFLPLLISVLFSHSAKSWYPTETSQLHVFSSLLSRVHTAIVLSVM